MNLFKKSQAFGHVLTFVLALCLLLPLALSGCASGANAQEVSASVVEAMSGGNDVGFARAYAPIPFNFPRDYGAHPQYRTEWWYYTGSLQSASGAEFGYQLTFFRSAITATLETRPSDWATNQVYMAHFAVSDIANKRHLSFERYSRGGGGLAGAVGEPSVQIWLEDWSVKGTTLNVYHMQASVAGEDGPVAIDFTLRQTRPPVLHGDQGLSQKGAEPGNASYYYSLVNLETTGVITVNGVSSQVQGLSWMDHEFGTSALSADAVGWDWFSMQLDNGAVLMVAQIRKKSGGASGDFAGTLVDGQGRQQTIRSSDLVLRPTGSWLSPRTGFRYPSGWQVSIPNQQIELTIEPLIRDQEMQVSFVYWEGAIKVSGSMGEQAVSGRGYVELTGYGAESGEYQR